jgi:ABC-type branched-subunit amino acid transport system substrate-binding protein
MTKRVATILLLGLWALFSTGPSAAEVGITDSEIAIGNPNVQSGDNAFSGLQTSIGLKAYIDSVNAAGGVNGRKIHLIQCDDKYDPEQAAVCFDQLQKSGVFAITGLVGSAPLIRYINLCTKSKTPLVGCYSGPQLVSAPAKRYIFTARPGYQDEERQFVDHMWNDAGVRKVAILYQDDAYGHDHLTGLEEALKKHGSTPVAAAGYKRNSNDLTTQFDEIRNAQPEAVCLAANHNQCVAFIKMARKANWNVIFYINSGANVDGFLPVAKDDGDGVLVSEVVPDVSRIDLPLITNYRKALEKFFPNEKPCFTSLRGYIDGVVLVEGLRRAGKDLTREKFVDALDNIHNWNIGLQKGIELSYSPTDHFGMHRYTFGVIKHGSVIPVLNWKDLKQKPAVSQ